MFEGMKRRFGDQVERQLGMSLVPEEARALVLERVARWRGEFVGPSRAWVDEAIQPVGESAKPAARLALLAALASFQIDTGVVGSFRERSSSDEALLGTVAWAAFTAARRVGTWLGSPGTAKHRAHNGPVPERAITSGGRSAA